MRSPNGRPSRRALLLGAGAAVLAACSRNQRGPEVSGRAASAQPSAAGTTPSAAAHAVPTAPTARAAVVVRHADSGRPEVALTFHGSGDPALADRLLGEAEQAGARVTVFAVGTWLDTHPEMARRILRGGHDLGNHTYTHPTLHRLSTTAIRAEVDRCAAVIERLTGSPGAGFRPSGGPIITPAMVAAATAAGYPLVLGYDVDPADNTDPGADAVAARVLAGVRRGSVVSLHLGHAGTVTALPRILAGLRSRGLTAVTATSIVAPR